MQELDTKYCSVCRQVLPLIAFHRSQAHKEGHYPICKMCRRVGISTNKMQGKVFDVDLTIIPHMPELDALSFYQTSGCAITKTKYLMKTISKYYPHYIDTIPVLQGLLDIMIAKSIGYAALEVTYKEGTIRCRPCNSRKFVSSMRAPRISRSKND